MKSVITNTFKEFFLWITPIFITFYTPAKFAIFTILILMIVDTHTGIKASRKENKKLTSNRFSDFFAKILGYSVFITIGLFLNIEFEIPYIVWVSAFVPIYLEIFSIDENQRRLGKKGIIKQSQNAYNFAKNIKSKKDKLR
jgi:hypothetical protein